MSGNVWEWCSDHLNVYPVCGRVEDPLQVDTSDPIGGSYRVTRGGGWNSVAEGCPVSGRDFFSPDFRLTDFGFRVVLTP
jgi:formylglycine-generating enzyme required for sulfatase activity